MQEIDATTIASSRSIPGLYKARAKARTRRAIRSEETYPFRVIPRGLPNKQARGVRADFLRRRTIHRFQHVQQAAYVRPYDGFGRGLRIRGVSHWSSPVNRAALDRPCARGLSTDQHQAD